jgi:hypothetical protein
MITRTTIGGNQVVAEKAAVIRELASTGNPSNQGSFPVMMQVRSD